MIVLGLANEYFSYVTTPKEYEKQQCEGASTLSGPQEGPAIIEMLEEVAKCHPCQTEVKAETYKVGPYPATKFGPLMLRRARNMVDEDLDSFAPEYLAYFETRVPRTEWTEDRLGDWLARDRNVSVWRMHGATPVLVDDERSWNFVTVLKAATDLKAFISVCGTRSGSRHRTRRTPSVISFKCTYRGKLLCARGPSTLGTLLIRFQCRFSRPIVIAHRRACATQHNDMAVIHPLNERTI